MQRVLGTAGRPRTPRAPGPPMERRYATWKDRRRDHDPLDRIAQIGDRSLDRYLGHWAPRGRARVWAGSIQLDTRTPEADGRRRGGIRLRRGRRSDRSREPFDRVDDDRSIALRPESLWTGGRR